MEGATTQEQEVCNRNRHTSTAGGSPPRSETFQRRRCLGPGGDHDVRCPFHGLRVGELRALESGSDIELIEKG
jgi:hypothetical protein